MRHAFAAALLSAAVWLPAAALAQPAAAPPAPPLMLKDLIGAPGKEVRVLAITSAPGAASAAHRHNGQVFVYMLSGSMIMQVQGQAPVTLTAGQTFYESPDDIHTMSRNASQTEPARFLAFMVLDKGAPVSVPVK